MPPVKKRGWQSGIGSDNRLGGGMGPSLGHVLGQDFPRPKSKTNAQSSSVQSDSGAVNTSGTTFSLTGLSSGTHLVSIRVEVSQASIDVADGVVDARYITWQVSGRNGTDTLDTFTGRETVVLEGLLSGHTETVNFNPCGFVFVGDSIRFGISSAGSWSGTAEIQAVRL